MDDENFEHEAFRSYVELYNDQVKIKAHNTNESKLIKSHSTNQCANDAL